MTDWQGEEGKTSPDVDSLSTTETSTTTAKKDKKRSVNAAFKGLRKGSTCDRIGLSAMLAQVAVIFINRVSSSKLGTTPKLSIASFSGMLVRRLPLNTKTRRKRNVAQQQQVTISSKSCTASFLALLFRIMGSRKKPVGRTSKRNKTPNTVSIIELSASTAFSCLPSPQPPAVLFSALVTREKTVRCVQLHLKE